MKRIVSIAAAALLGAACGPDNPGGGETCSAGLLAGDLVITEIMANPEGQDEGNEWIEIFNATSAPIDLTGLAVLVSRGDGESESVHTMREQTIGPGQYLVVGGILDEFKPVYVDYGYAADLSLRNSDGRVALRCQSTVVDEAFYAEAASGRSLELDGSQAPDHLRNDDAVNFCDATAAFDENNFGTPQESNGFCTIVVPGTCNDGGEPRDTVPPGVGDVIITELMPNPAGNEGQDKEWIELLALAEFDLNGLNVGLEPGNPRAQFDSPDCVLVGPGTLILFAQSDDPLVNGGLPQPDSLFGFDMKAGTTSTGDGQIFVGIGDQALDVITYTDSEDGVSLNLNPDLFDPVANDDPAGFCNAITPYGDEGSFGTPRAENTGCAAEGQCIDEGTGTARDIVPATDVRITEVMTRTLPDAQSASRWFEVQFVAAGDLNGLEMGRDDGAVNFATVSSPGCIPIAAGGHAILARSANLADNGLPRVDGTFDFTLILGTDRLFVGFGGVELDAVDYPATASGDAGTSQQRDDADVFCTSLEAGAEAYDGANNIGTPGAASLPCP